MTFDVEAAAVVLSRTGEISEGSLAVFNKLCNVRYVILICVGE